MMASKQKKLLITSSSIDEAVTQVILKHQTQFDLKIHIILLHELLSDFNINDELSDKASIIRWSKPNQAVISNQTHYLLNRILCVPDDLFLNFIESDREYAKREFEAYLGYSLSSFKGVSNHTINGMCEQLYSLPEQWQLLQKTSLKTPKYYWGPKPLCDLNQNLIYSNIYDVYHWKATQKTPRKNHVFCFEKPPGQPLFILSLGEQTLITSHSLLSENLKNHVLKQLKTIRACFGYFIFETLLFIQDNNIHFGCVNLALTHSKKHPDFEAFILKHLTQAYFKCLN
ncbi:MAG: hypothetical protein QNK11_07055 [Legionella sp.]|nr:hypothetical protein [Legionella sp.]